MTERAIVQAALDSLSAKQGTTGTITPLNLSADQLQVILDNAVMADEVTASGGQYKWEVNATTESLDLIRITGAVEELVGQLGGGFTDQLVYTKALGGVRFLDEASGFEYFVNRRDVSGAALGAVFGNFDSPDGNFLATSEAGGFEVCQKTNTDTSQILGNISSTNYIENTVFSFLVTSSEVKPYGIQALKFEGETDLDFTDIGFDTRILDSTGNYVYSDIQSKAIFDADPSSSKFRVSSVSGLVTLPMSQPFPMDSSTSYTIEYTFASPIRLKGDGAQPTLIMSGKQLEYFPVNYAAEVEVYTSNFVARSGRSYKIDTSGGSVVATVHPTVKSVTIGDFDDTWDNVNSFTLDFDSLGTLTFNTPNKGLRLEVIKYNNTYRVYNGEGRFIGST